MASTTQSAPASSVCSSGLISLDPSIPMVQGVPITTWVGMSWEDFLKWIEVRCAAILKGQRSHIDMADVTQEVVVAMLKRGFGRKFDPRRGSPLGYVQTVIARECFAAIRERGRRHRLWQRLDKCEESTEPSPGRAAELIEAARAIEEVGDHSRSAMTPAEQKGLAGVMLRARGTAAGRNADSVASSSQEHRCRKRLFTILKTYR